MGYFVGYRFTGADPAYLDKLLPLVRDTFAEEGVETYCTYFDELSFQKENLNQRQIMEHAFIKINEAGGFFVLIDGPEKSEGQLIEVGYCFAKGIPIVVAKRRSVQNTYVDKMANVSFEYDDLEGLAQKIKTFCKGA
jgi:nucleoside 2-deoxyribosyltransferase